MSDKKAKIEMAKDHEMVEFIRPVKVVHCYYRVGEKAAFHKKQCENLIKQKFAKKA